MSALKKNVVVGALSLTLASTILTSPSHAVGKGDPRFKNNLGLSTVECQVHLNEPGNPVVGYVVGNHGKDPAEAEKEANDFVSRFNDPEKPEKRPTKSHCHTVKKYRQSGAYGTDWQPK